MACIFQNSRLLENVLNLLKIGSLDIDNSPGMTDFESMVTALGVHIQDSEHKQLLVYTVGLEALFTAPLVICCLFVSSVANAGFAYGILVGFLNVIFVLGSYWTLKDKREGLYIGFMIGVSTMMSLLNFMNSIFWGQLSGCQPVPSHIHITQYSCENPAAYGAVCTFSVFLFLSQGFFTVGATIWKDELISELCLDTNKAVYTNLPLASQHESQPSESVDL